MRRLLLGLSILVSMNLGACKKVEESPKISRESFKTLLRDMHLAHAGVENKYRENKEREKMYDVWNEQLFSKHGVSGEDFFQTLRWYQARPYVMDTLYGELVNYFDVRMLEEKKKNNKNKGIEKFLEKDGGK